MPSLKKRTSQERVPALSSDRTTQDGASMEPCGCNRWQPVANQASRKTAQIARNGLPPVATSWPESFMVRRGRRFESVRGLCKSPAHAAF
jgi:hypothetical protein